MDSKFSAMFMIRLLFQPTMAFRELADLDPSPYSVFFKLTLWMGILPPLFAYFGATHFGWRLGATEPLYLPEHVLIGISSAYFCTMIFGFLSTAVVSRWMAVTYDARDSLGVHLALITFVAAPIAVGSIIHLFPSVFINVLMLVPVLIWSMYLLYRGLPVVLHTTPERGMLMASSLIGYLLVAVVSLLGLTVILWSHGIGPALGI